jgi:uncharacterized protein (DUF885 family)
MPRLSRLGLPAQRRLGERFDLRDFNDQVVASGNVPLALLAGRL